MQDDSTDAVTALYRLAAAQVELHDALLRLRETCDRTAAAMRGTALGAGDREAGALGHPDLAELDAMLTRFYG